MTRFNQSARAREVNRVRLELEQRSYPRLQMLILVALTGAAGFLASYGLRQFGMDEMWLRYPASMCAAYLMFLALLWLWLRSSATDYLDAADPAFNALEGSASGRSSLVTENVGTSLGDSLASVADAEEFAIPLALLLALIAVMVSFFVLISSVVVSAPLLFAELLVDGLLSASLYRRLRGIDRTHWLETAVSRTIWPFALATLVMALAGIGMKLVAPQAHSVGEFVVAMGQGGGDKP